MSWENVDMLHQKGLKKHFEGVHGTIRNIEHESFSSRALVQVILSDWCSISTLFTDMVPNCPYEILSMCLFKLLLTLLIVVVSWAQAILLWTSISKLSTDIVPNDFMHCFNMLIQCTLLTQRGWISTHCRYGSYVLMHCFHIMI